MQLIRYFLRHIIIWAKEQIPVKMSHVYFAIR